MDTIEWMDAWSAQADKYYAIPRPRISHRLEHLITELACTPATAEACEHLPARVQDVCTQLHMELSGSAREHDAERSAVAVLRQAEKDYI